MGIGTYHVFRKGRMDQDDRTARAQELGALLPDIGYPQLQETDKWISYGEDSRNSRTVRVRSDGKVLLSDPNAKDVSDFAQTLGIRTGLEFVGIPVRMGDFN